MRHLLAISVAVAALCAKAEGLCDQIWFYADFDRPAQIAGKLLPFEGDEDAYVDGKFGKAYFFRRPSANILPPMSDFLAATNSFDALDGPRPKIDLKTLTVSYPGGEFEVARRGPGIPSHWVNKWGASVFSVEVKGRKGTIFTITPDVASITDKQIAALKKANPKFSVTNLLKTVAEPRTVKLTGEWQRVWNSARIDLRIRDSQVGFKLKSSGPIELRKFMLQSAGTFPYHGFDNPTEWVDGGQRRWERHIHLADDPETLGSFPYSNGTFTCTYRTPEGWVPTNQPFTVFTRGTAWDKTLIFSSTSFTPGPGCRLAPKMPKRSGEWRQFTATWNPEAVNIYLDGKKIYTEQKPKLADYGEKGYFTIGGKDASADMVLDEVGIFKRALTEDEVKALAEAKSGLREGPMFLASSSPIAAYPRNCEDAALRFSVDSPGTGSCTAQLRIGEVDCPPQTVALKTGGNEVSLRFRAADFPPGEHPWTMRLVMPKGREVVSLKGRLTILPRFERDGFRLLSWGYEPRYIDFYKTCGINSVVVNDTSPKGAAKALDAGLGLCVRLENVGEWRSCNFDRERIRAKVERRLAPYRGLMQWDSTLVNSETYGAQSGEAAVKFGAWRDWARKELGHEPVVAFSYTPCGILWGKVGAKLPHGVLRQNDCYDTLAWLMKSGMPNHFVNGVNREVIHRFSPGNIVWSEPSPSPDELDMTADWIYNFDPGMCLGYLRYYEATPRPAGKRFQPTLAMGYWSPDFPEIQIDHPTQTDAKTGKKVRVMMGQTADELAIKSWMCIGGSAADAISYFSADWSWAQAMTNGVLHEKGLPLVYSPGWQKHCLAEKDCAARYGEFVRTRLMPAATLLRGIPTERAPIALLLPSEIGYSGEFWWPRVNFTRYLCKLLSKMPVPFDVALDGDYTVENLSKYAAILYPQLNCITPEHSKVLHAVAASTKVYVDNSYHLIEKAGCDNNLSDFKYPVERLKGFNNNYPWTEKNVDGPLARWMEPQLEAFRTRLSAWSDEDGTNAWTFAKEYKGVRYVTVVNNLRRAGGCPQADIYTNATYRPMGAPQRITTHIRDFKGAIVYEFNSDCGIVRLKDCLIEKQYGPAEARVFCVYPKPLEAPTLTLEGEPRAGGKVTLVVRIRERGGKPAPGRQVVRLELRDSKGAVRDESGLYVVEGGEARIPLYFRRADEAGGMLSKWRATVADLTTGEDVTLKFALRD